MGTKVASVEVILGCLSYQGFAKNTIKECRYKGLINCVEHPPKMCVAIPAAKDCPTVTGKVGVFNFGSSLQSKIGHFSKSKHLVQDPVLVNE
mmetsp:Transcript_7832/g.12442  ORF Transcript_7832/g.12442 Transcript_7832/m.12442 type:complete len:92 (-) Transcript_7832:1158-1433(-)